MNAGGRSPEDFQRRSQLAGGTSRHRRGACSGPACWRLRGRRVLGGRRRRARARARRPRRSDRRAGAATSSSSAASRWRRTAPAASSTARSSADGPHIFAAQFANGAWRPPQRVDRGRRRLRLLVAGDRRRQRRAPARVWVAGVRGGPTACSPPRSIPGARRFQPPVPIDLNVGDAGARRLPVGLDGPGGQANLVYRVITDAAAVDAPPGIGPRRVPRGRGSPAQFWRRFGSPLNRNRGVAAADPSAAQPRRRSRPTSSGNAVVAWQERRRPWSRASTRARLPERPRPSPCR